MGGAKVSPAQRKALSEALAKRREAKRPKLSPQEGGSGAVSDYDESDYFELTTESEPEVSGQEATEPAAEDTLCMSEKRSGFAGVGGAKANLTLGRQKLSGRKNTLTAKEAREIKRLKLSAQEDGSGVEPDFEESDDYEVTTESEPEVSGQEAAESPKEATETPKEAIETPKEAIKPPAEGGCPGDVELGPVWYTKGIDGRLMKCHSPYTILDTRDKKTGKYQIVQLSGLTVKGYRGFPYNMYDNAYKSDSGVALYFKKQHCNVNLTVDGVMHNIFGIHYKWRPATPEEEAANKRA